jgi:hypothetical protein
MVSLLSSGTMKGPRLPVSFPKAPFPSPVGTTLASLCFVPENASVHHSQAWNLFFRFCPSGFVNVEITGSPQFLENPNMHLPCSPTPAGLYSPSLYSDTVLPPLLQRRRLPPLVSFETQSHGFCIRCLRFVPSLLATTQDSLPVGG